MGIDITTYLGPYLECKSSRMKVHEKYRACDNEKCSHYHKEVGNYRPQRFCPDCGSKIEEIEKDSINTDEVAQKLKEVLYHAHRLEEFLKGGPFYIWLPKRTKNSSKITKPLEGKAADATMEKEKKK